MSHASDMIDQEAFAGLLAECNQAQAEIERLQAALKPFAMCAGGMILNPSPDDWQRAKEVMGMVPADEQETHD